MDLSGLEIVLRAWLAVACAAILFAVVGCHPLSSALDRFARYRSERTP